MRTKTRAIPKVLLACCGVLLAATLSSRPAAAQEAPAMRGARTQQILGNQFPVGFYYYDTGFRRLPDDPSNRSLDEIKRDINTMADKGFNYVHVQINIRPGVPEYPELDAVLEVAAKRHMAVRVLWYGLVYLQKNLTGRRTGEWKPGWNAKRLADVVVPFIKKYKDNPQIVDFSVQEEPPLVMLPRLHEYYQAIREQVPDVRLELLYNNAYISAADIDNLYPQNTSADMYPFAQYSNNGISTPAYALQDFNTRVSHYQRVAQQRNQAFEVILGSYALPKIYTPEQVLPYLQSLYKKEADPQAMVDRDMRLAKMGNRGFSIDADGNTRRWSRYFAPPNYVTAMAWLALANGADSESMYKWAGKVPPKSVKDYGIHILGRDRQGTYGLDEFAAFAKQIRPFGKLFRSAKRDVAPYPDPKDPTSSIYAIPKDFSSLRREELLGAPVLETTAADLKWSSFTLPDLKGKLVVIVNTLGGTWSDGKSPLKLEESDPFHINDNGELTDYTPFTKDRAVQAKVLLPQTQVTDLMTGKPISVSADGTLKLDIAPGGGRILFLSPAGSNEPQKLMTEYLKP